MAQTFTSALRLTGTPVDLSSYDTRATPGFTGDKAAGAEALAACGEELADLQERLFAERTTGSQRRVLLILQGMDTSGKGGVLRHAVGLVDPQGVRISSFKAPTEEELAHDFLWRIEKELPEAGLIGVFDRSHYEDVLIARVRELADPAELERRYQAINDFEAGLVDQGYHLIKCMLHLGPEEQKERLQARLEDPTKHWKFNPGDIDEREKWDDYQQAYEIALERTHTAQAPWYVIPSDRKWYRNLAVAELLREALQELDPQWPTADFDVAGELARLESQDLSR